MADAIFENPRLAAIYDLLDGDRRDLDPYVTLVDEVGAHSVLDIGCGTGTFACILARRGVEVIGLDPAAASLEVARRKPCADRVRWVHGSAAALPPVRVDMVTMTGNVAQTLVTDEEWEDALSAARNALTAGGLFAFEVRNPAKEEWREWTRERSHRVVALPGNDAIETWVELTAVSLPLVSFRHTYVFASDGAVLTSDSTLRFRTRAEIEHALRTAGFSVHDIRDAPDRPGRELVFLARLRPRHR